MKVYKKIKEKKLVKKKLGNLLKNKKSKLIIILITVAILLAITFSPNGVYYAIRNAIQKEETYSFSYELKSYDINKNEYSILIKITNPEGIKEIEYPDEQQILNCNNQKKVGFDYVTKDMKDYEFTITLSTGEVKKETIQFERPRTGKDSYKKVNGIYVNEPNIQDGLNKEYTRYLILSDDGTLKPGNWITDSAPDNWYDYKNQKWANICVETNGILGYYVGIPRYAYKIAENNEAGNERVDIKFIDVYNNYTNPETDEKTYWEELKSQGYEIPEAFEFGNYNEISISGYWMSKYELSDLEKYVIDYNLTASVDTFNVSNFKVNTDKEIAK